MSYWRPGMGLNPRDQLAREDLLARPDSLPEYTVDQAAADTEALAREVIELRAARTGLQERVDSLEAALADIATSPEDRTALAVRAALALAPHKPDPLAWRCPASKEGHRCELSAGHEGHHVAGWLESAGGYTERQGATWEDEEKA